MMPEHLARAVRERCPFQKTECFFAEIGACAVVGTWIWERKAYWGLLDMAELKERKREASRRGGMKAAEVRWGFQIEEVGGKI